MKMKNIITLILCVALVVLAGLIPVRGSNTQGAKGTVLSQRRPGTG